MNATIARFGHPATLVRDYTHWVVLLRPAQSTLGALVLAAKSEATAFGALEPAAHAELAPITRDIEAALAATSAPDKINYLMLMMADPHVHFHVLPRYAGERARGDTAYPDAGWPKVPDLGAAVALDDGQIADLVGWLRAGWPTSDR